MSAEYVKLTRREFELIRSVIDGEYSAAGGMDEEPQKLAEDAYEALLAAEKRNGIPRTEY